MAQEKNAQRTIGCLSTWSVYEGTAVDWYILTLFEGIDAAARERDCNLLLGCGISLPDSPRASRTSWAVPSPDADFVPVGPWNTDGLIIIPDDLAGSQLEYVQGLIDSGFPIILTTPEKPGPLVAVDNAGGIRQAFDHLLQHGHSQIAFIAGKSDRGGDTTERLAAFRQALSDAGIKEDNRLIAYGEHRREDGRIAMQKILASGAPFSAVMASNDLSAIGAMDALAEAGRRIPEDVAVIGFDDILAARSHLAPLTTVRNPTFDLGHQAVLCLLDSIAGTQAAHAETRVPTRLVIRQSCGCRPESAPVTTFAVTAGSNLESTQATLAQAMAEAALLEGHSAPDRTVGAVCSDLVRAFTSSLSANDPTPFDAALQGLFVWVQEQNEDAYAWHPAFSALRSGVANLLPEIPEADLVLADAMIDRARLEIAQQVHRQAADTLLCHMEMANRAGLMTSQLLGAKDTSATGDVLARHLPQLGIEHLVAALYASRDDDPLPDCDIILDAGLEETAVGRRFAAQDFPPSGLYPPHSPYRLAILPLVIDDDTAGFVALSDTNLEPSAAIVHNLASALQRGQLLDEMKRAQGELARSNKELELFAYVASHDLQEPLRMVRSYVELLERRYKGSLDDEADEFIGFAIDGATRMQTLINDLLAYSRVGTRGKPLEPTDSGEILKNALANLSVAIEESGAEVTSDELPTVMADPTQLAQLLQNLIGNAVKFRGDRAPKIHVGAEAEGDEWTYSVSDNGIGIASEHFDRVFMIFQRLHTREEYEGTGIGLAVCKKIVERHGGRIWVESRPGEGSTFYFTLPQSRDATL